METRCKIIRQPENQAVRLLLNGKVDQAALAELEDSVSKAQLAQQLVYIDLSEVTLVDRRTAEYLAERASAQVRIVNCPNYLKHWIAQGTHEFES